MPSFVFPAKYYLDAEIEENEIRETCNMHGEMRCAYKVLAGNPKTPAN
jgi:hypothetical protein